MARFRSLFSCVPTCSAHRDGSNKKNQHSTRLKGDSEEATLILDNFQTLSDEKFKEFMLCNLDPSVLDKPFTFEIEMFCCCGVKIMLDLELGRVQSCLKRLSPFVSNGQCPHVTGLRQHSTFGSYGALQQVNHNKWRLRQAYWSDKIIYRIIDFSSIRLVHLACAFGKLDIVKTLKSMGCNFDTTEKSEETPLDIAIIYGHSEIFEFLTSTADVSISDRSLEKAATYNREEMLVTILKQKSFTKPSLSSALSSAAGRGHMDIVRVLLGSGATPNKEAVQMAIECQDLSTVKLYLASGANVLPKHVAHAVKTCDVDMVELLLTKGWEEDVNKHLTVPLIVWAAFNNEVKLLRRLIELNVDIDVNYHGYTALDWALVLGWAECIYALETVGAKTNPEIALKSPPLYEIWFIDSKTTRADIIERLVLRGYDVNAYTKTSSGTIPDKTPFDMAIQFSDILSIRCLLKYGADPYITHDRAAESPVYCVIRTDKWSLVEEMILSNIIAIPESKQKSDFFEKLCVENYDKYVDMLLKCGWRISNQGLSTIHKNCENVNIQTILKQHMSTVPSLSTLCRNTTRLSCGSNIRTLLETKYLPSQIRHFLSLQDVIDDVKVKYNVP